MEAWAHKIRSLGNEAAHGDTPFPREEAQSLYDFTRLVFMYFFTLPQHGVAAGAGERRPERVSDGGRRSEAHEHERRRLQHRAGTLPGGIHGRERPRRGQRV